MIEAPLARSRSGAAWSFLMNSVPLLTPPEPSAYKRRPDKKRGMEVVEELLAERARGWTEDWSWPLVRPLLYRVLDFDKAVRMADLLHHMDGVDALQMVSVLLELQVETVGADRIPASGPVFIVSNHPSSIADGVVMDDAVRPVRGDLVYFANSDAFRVAPNFDQILIPVEWVEEKRSRGKTRETLKLAQQAHEKKAAVVIFPAGRIAKYKDGALRDPEWESTAVALARKKGAPILPVHMTGRSSRLYHLADRFSPALRDMTLFHEMMNRQGRRATVTFGPLIPPDRLGGEPEAVTRALKDYVELTLPKDPDAAFEPPSAQTQE